MTRIIGDERREKLRERVLQCLIVNGGELTRTMVKAGAFGGDVVLAAELTDALDSLEAAGLVTSRKVDRVVGKFGRGTRLFRYVAAVATAGADGTDYGERMTTAVAVSAGLQPEDHELLVDTVHRQLSAIRDRAGKHQRRILEEQDALEECVAVEAQWVRLATSILGAELQEDADAADTASAAS